MKRTDYLYGIGEEPPEFDPYVIVRRIQMLEDNLSELLEVDYKHRDFDRIREIQKEMDKIRALSSI